MGHAYEQYTATYLKRQQGQFFTNRLVTDFMVSLLDPDYQDVILDPAGGSGGFLTATMRYIRQKILTREATETAKQRQLDQHRTKLFMVEMSKRLVKIAKTAMILNGDGHAGMTQGDSLGVYSDLNEEIVAKCGRGKPKIIVTNPPFAGVGEGRITDEKLLSNFQCGMKWTERDGKYEMSNDVIEDGVPPELLFFERCVDWLAPGGRLGIVLPKSFLDTQTYASARRLLFRQCKLLAVMNCHKNTFQPHTGVRTCLIFIEKLTASEVPPTDYPVFMAVSRKIGQDSEGVPLFRRDENNNPTDEIDHDLDEILRDWKNFKAGKLVESEYRFSVSAAELCETYTINPQFYLPNLNRTIREIEAIDGKDGWSVVTLGQILAGVQIFKGPRIKTENLTADSDANGEILYYTPSAVLQEKSDSAKPINLARATEKQLRTIEKLKVYRGDILITRSGTIGRVAYVTKRLDGEIISDDMIRVRIPEDFVRLYVYSFLQTDFGLNQMLRNEYGSVQQHLEAKHVGGILIPVPPKWEHVSDIVDRVRRGITAREMLEESNRLAFGQTVQLVRALSEAAA